MNLHRSIVSEWSVSLHCFAMHAGLEASHPNVKPGQSFSHAIRADIGALHSKVLQERRNSMPAFELQDLRPSH